MPRNYVRKQLDRKLVTEEQIARAKRLISEGMSQRRAAEQVGISEGGLRKRLKNINVPISLGRFRPTFNKAQELEFAVHCRKMDEMFFGLTINDMRRLAYEYAVANNVQHRFNDSSKMAGRDWVECFIRRHPSLCLRQSAPTSLARAIGFNKVQVERFYKNLKEVYDKFQFPPNKIYNMDETGVSTVPKKTPKVVSSRGKKVVGKIVSAERGTTITAVLSMSVTGQFIPPAFIYPRKRPRAELLDGAPLQSIMMVSDSGFINTDLFVNWLHHFKHFSCPTQEEPVLLILDNHSTHISLEATRYARENHIVMVTLPPHGSHKLQPLDVAVHSPLKTKYAIECEKWMTQHPGRGITQFQVASLFGAAFKQVATMSNAESGFRATGIFPFADDLFDEADFAPSFVTDQFSRSNDPSEDDCNQRRIENVLETNEREMSPSLIDNDTMHPMMSISTNERTKANVPETSECEVSPTLIVNDTKQSMMNICTNEEEVTLSTCDLTVKRSDLLDANSIVHACNDEPMEVVETNKSVPEKTDATEFNVSINKENKWPDNQAVKLVDLSPLPKMINKKKKTSRASLKSEIITASPFKNQLEDKRKIEEAKKPRKLIKPMNLDSQPGPSGTDRNLNKVNNKSYKKDIVQKQTVKKARSKPMREHSHYYCPICKEKYEYPPTEDWIQCSVCEKWFHEECTAYSGGSFTCDFCEEC